MELQQLVDKARQSLLFTAPTLERDLGRFLTDQYAWIGLSASRPWREWHILERAWQAGLPVPKPIAACVCRKYWWYHAGIITAYLADTETLAARLQSARRSPSTHRPSSAGR